MLLPMLLNSHYPRFVALALGPNQSVHLFHFIAGKKKARWQRPLADAASAMTSSVNDRVTQRTTLLAQANAKP